MVGCRPRDARVTGPVTGPESQDLALAGWSICGVTMERRGVMQLDFEDRASRYPVNITVRYRPLGEIGWVESKTINISRSGILFEADEPLDVDTPLEISFDLPTEFGGSGDGTLTCRGMVVRTIMPPASDAPPVVAATIANYRSS